MIVNLEDAGFNVGFTPIYWAYASGFPKAQNIGKTVDKRLGVEREIVGRYKRPDGSNPRKAKQGFDNVNYVGTTPETRTLNGESLLTKPSTIQAKALDGSYAGFQPKPAVEVIIVAMKPLSEKTYVDQALKNRKGITWLDEGRIPYESEDDKIEGQSARPSKTIDTIFPIGGFDRSERSQILGRFPANLLVSDDVLNDGKISKSSDKIRHNRQDMYSGRGIYGKYNQKDTTGYADSGSFSRYFDLDKWFEERLKELPVSVQKTFPFLIVPKASKSEKDKGLDYSPEPIKGRDEGQDIRNVPQKARNTPRVNQHPTVKPLKLMSYLITLGSREGNIVLDPFVGSGTTCLAAQMLNRRSIGYEIAEEYCKIAVKRLSVGTSSADNL